MAGGRVGDAFWAGGGEHYFQFADMGTLASLDDMIAADHFDLSQFYKTVVDSMVFNGKMDGVPYAAHPGRCGLFYNKAVFDQAKVSYPTDTWTYDDLLAASLKLVKAGATYGLDFEQNVEAMTNPLRAFGGDVIDAAGKKSLLDRPEAAKAFQWLSDAALKYKISAVGGLQASAITNRRETLFAAGKLAMFMSGMWARGVESYLKDKTVLAIAPTPLGPANSHGPTGVFDALVMTSASRAKSETWQWLKFNVTKEAGILQGQNQRPPGARPDVWESAEMTADPLFRPWPPLLKGAEPLHLPANHRGYDLSQMAQPALESIQLGKQPLEQGLAELHKVVQAALDLPSLAS
jgi:multiple sugar transport system substrate-binding protein